MMCELRRQEKIEALVPDYDIGSWLGAIAKMRGDHPLLVWAPFDGPTVTISYAAFLDKVQRLAGGMHREGIQRGDRVLLHLDNCPETLLARFACAWLGAVAVVTNSTSSAKDVEFFVQSSRAKAAITQARYATLFEGASSNLRWIATVDDGAGEPYSSVNTVRFEFLYGESKAKTDMSPYDDALVMFTTGSTARPKGAVWTHGNVVWAAQLNAQQQGSSPNDIHLLFLPLFHVVGYSWAFLSTVHAGGTVILQPRFSKSRFWSVADKYNANVSSHVLFTLAVLRKEEVPKHTFRRWITPRYDNQDERLFGVSVLAGWGMTEVLAQAIVSSPYMPTADSAVGRPSLAYDIRIEDENGEAVAPGESGHLTVRGVPGYSLFKGYDGDAEATSQAFDENGFLRTGDRVRLMHDGSIRWEERTKDVIKVGGENVSALEIEKFLISLPGVVEAAVVGKPDSIYGEVLVAFVVANSTAKASELSEFCLSSCSNALARYKVPNAVYVVGEIPRIGVGKPAKATLREVAKADNVHSALENALLPVNVLGAQT